MEDELVQELALLWLVQEVEDDDAAVVGGGGVGCCY